MSSGDDDDRRCGQKWHHTRGCRRRRFRFRRPGSIPPAPLRSAREARVAREPSPRDRARLVAHAVALVNARVDASAVTRGGGISRIPSGGFFSSIRSPHPHHGAGRRVHEDLQRRAAGIHLDRRRARGASRCPEPSSRRSSLRLIRVATIPDRVIPSIDRVPTRPDRGVADPRLPPPPRPASEPLSRPSLGASVRTTRTPPSPCATRTSTRPTTTRSPGVVLRP